MKNAYIIKKQKDNDNDIFLYKLEPPTRSGTEFILLKLEKIKNKRFEDIDFINFYYAKSNLNGDLVSDWVRYTTLESKNVFHSPESFRKMYGGLEKPQIEEYRQEYFKLFSDNNREFKKDQNYYEHKLKDLTLSPYEKSIYQGILKIMQEVSGGITKTPISENPQINNTIIKLFSNIDDGYKVIERPKIGRKLELENKQMKNKMIKLKNLSILEAKPIEWDDFEEPNLTPQEKAAGNKSNRISSIFSDSAPKEDSNKVINYSGDDSGDVETMTNRVTGVRGPETVGYQDKYNAKIIFACDKDGNLTDTNSAYIKILWFQTPIPVSHISQQFNYNFLVLMNGKILEPTTINANPSDQFGDKIQKSLFNYLQSSKFVPEQELLSFMKASKNKLFVNGNLLNGVNLYKKIPINKDTSTEFRLEQVSVSPNQIIDFISKPLKEKGGGLGSTLSKNSTESGLENFKDKKWEQDPEYKQIQDKIKQIQSELNAFTQIEQTRNLSEDEKDAKFDLGVQLSKLEKQRSIVGAKVRKQNTSENNFVITYVDKGYRIFPSKFDRAPDKNTERIDMRDVEEFGAPKKKKRVVFDTATNSIKEIEESLDLILSNDKLNKILYN